MSKKRAAGVISISSASSDDELPTPLIKRKRSAESVKLSHITSELKEVKDSIARIFKVTNSMNIPVGLRDVLYDTFKCSICQATPMAPPIIFAKCCKTILGCEKCVDTWYHGSEGQNRTCPKCRGERAYVETCRLNGLDEFLGIIEPILEGAPADSDELMD